MTKQAILDRAAPEGDRLIDTAQAAEKLGVSVSLMKEWRATGEGPAFCKLHGRLIRYKTTTLDAWIADLEEQVA